MSSTIEPLWPKSLGEFTPFTVEEFAIMFRCINQGQGFDIFKEYLVKLREFKQLMKESEQDLIEIPDNLDTFEEFNEWLQSN